MQSASTPRPLFDKLRQSHVAARTPDAPALPYSDRRLAHEATPCLFG